MGTRISNFISLLFAVSAHNTATIRHTIRHIQTQKKRRPRVAYSQIEAFAMPLRSNKQQETYADMTAYYLCNAVGNTHKRTQHNVLRR